MPAKRKPHKTNRTDRTGDGSAPYDRTGTTGDGSAPYDRTGTTGDGSVSYPLFYRPLSRLRMRMHINRAIHILVYAGLIFSGAFFALSLSAVIIPVPFFWNKAMLGFVLVFGLTLLSVPFISPRRLTVIKTADSLGLKERVITAFLLQDSDSPVAKLQRLDTLETLSNTDFRKLYRLKFPVREVALSVALLLLATALFMVPSEARYKASVLENVTNEIRKQADIIKEGKEKIAQKSESGDEMLSKMEEELNKLLDALKKANSEEDALKELSKTSHKIEDIAKENSERMAALSSKLIEKPMTQRLGEALSKGADDDFEKELEDLLKKLDEMAPEEAKELAEQLEDAASALGEGMPLAQNLEELAAALASGDMTRAAGAVSKASSLIAMAMRNTGSDEIQNIMGAIGEAGRRISSAAGNENRFNRMALAGSRAFPGEVPDDETTGGGGAAPGNEGKGGENGGSSGSNAGGQGGNQGSGQGSNQGSGQGSGDGAGDGSTNMASGYQQEGPGGAGREPGKESLGEYEEIYVPVRMEDGGDVSHVPGRENESGQSRWYSTGLPVEKGSVIPYNSVFSDYKKDAFYRIEQAGIPPGMKDIVREYFSSLE